MITNEDLLVRALQAFRRGYAGEPGTLRPRQAGKTAAGVRAVIELLVSDALAFPREPSDAMEWAFHNGVPVNARHNFLNRYRAMRAAAVDELVSMPAPQADVCSCPEHGSWYHAEDIDKMVKEISDALGSTATRPKLCDIVVETVRAIGAKPAQPTEAARVGATVHITAELARDLVSYGESLKAPEPWMVDELHAALAHPRPTGDGMVSVVAEDANNYCRILTALGMEEEGDPVTEVERLVALSEAPTVEQAGEVVGEAGFTEWFVKNYPGPNTIISNPLWHAPRIFRAALYHAQPRPVGVPDGWQDIATAPNDGTPHVRGLHVYGPDGKYLYWEEVAGHIDTEDGAFYSEGDVSGWDASDFSHWHPLAAAPAPGKGGEA